ncbi:MULTISPECIES: Na(+)/H(+) antiporter subunit B [Prolixibacter]|jgi:uncharacterized MnhB-related membrane protein|uniref:Putative MnhB-related membrane protein n=1 Tax=Prolixibacter denitrificans TaxID=1541063 RepID=A0A2P8CEA2_9BACT|nr:MULTISPECIES: hydrogenase subunit MbhD domain-containing protein [Prolixibacter]PSK83314.1 putative MnhB-related membrane protein [Prolixibacter denitrificans]GET21803.1 hypothetical protein JCM18694_20490 [Prolixibacter denitrificans]GET24533.1 hypothetical protein NT017_08620 [Prolixibacter sp. NT017]
MIYLIIAIVLGIIMLVAAVIAVYNKDLKTAIIAAGVTSLFASVLYVLLAAPDVALTEASIGSGLTTLIFFYVYNKIRRNNAQE